MKKVTPFLMFQNNDAEEAMNYYISIFEDSEIISIKRYGANESGSEGTVNEATITIKGQEIMCFDSPIKHQFDFTPSISFFITCDSEDEINDLYEKLKMDGAALMPIDNYGFSKKFAWVNDKFGISWQLNLPE